MRLPVIIAARNEQDRIAQTLQRLDAARVNPFIIVNDSQDATAAEARRFTDNVFELSTPGKVQAIQYGLQQLHGEALDLVLYTDADSYPLFPKAWPDAMVHGLGKDSLVASGLCLASDDTLTSRVTISACRIVNALNKLLLGKPHITGANMISHFKTSGVLDRVLALDNYWPRADDALVGAIAPDGAFKHAILNPHAVVATSSRFVCRPHSAMFHPGDARKSVAESRLQRSAPGTRPYSP